MAIEIERKFLVDKAKWSLTSKEAPDFYQQGYLLTAPAKTIRVRLTNKEAFITIKGSSTGASRAEFEYSIPKEDASILLANFSLSIITKHRYKIYYGSTLWEVDEFLGDNEGLLMAEVELKSEDEAVALPEWISKEVTGDERYYNSNLSLHPYKNGPVQ